MVLFLPFGQEYSTKSSKSYVSCPKRKRFFIDTKLPFFFILYY